MAKKRNRLKRLFIVPTMTISFFSSNPIFSAEAKKPLKAIQELNPREGYTINFTNVSMLELLKFISKISESNFVYDPLDLQFTVTFTSEEPTSLDNIMTAFTQILQIHGLSLIEEGNNVVIHKNPAIKQIPQVVSDDHGLSKGEKPFLVTRVFSIHNANPMNLATVIKPMLSASAVLTAFEDTRQMILMDLSSNVSKVAELLSFLDTPANNLQVKSYKFKNGQAEDVAPLLNQLIMPLSEGNPVIIVPQKDLNSIFLVSTPYLIQKSLEILMQLDNFTGSEDRDLHSDNVLIYQLSVKSYSAIQKGLKDILMSASKQGFNATGLNNAINSLEYIQATNSILFIGDKLSLEKIKNFLIALDTTSKGEIASENSKFFVYEPENKSAEEIFNLLKEIKNNLASSHLADLNMVATLDSMQLITKSNSIMFTGEAKSVDEVIVLLKSLDQADDEFLIYTPVNLSPQTLMDSLKQVTKRLSSGGLEDSGFIKSIEGAKYIPSSFSIVFNGSKATIDRVKKMMDELDQINKKVQLDEKMLMYKLKFISKKTLDSSLEVFAESLPIDNPVQETLEQRTFLPQSSTVIFRGPQEALDTVKQFLETTDTEDYDNDRVLMYKIKSSDPELVIENLKLYMNELGSTDPVYQSIKTFKYVPNSKLIVFKGSDEVTKKLESLMTGLDDETIKGDTQTLNYKIKAPNPKSLLLALKNYQEALSTTDPIYRILKSAHFVENANVIIFKGPEERLKDVNDLLLKLDPGSNSGADEPTQVVYTLKVASGESVLSHLNAVKDRMKKDPSYKGSTLIETMNNIEWVPKSNSFYVSGSKKDVDQVMAFITQFDNDNQENTNLVYKLQFIQGDVAIKELKNLSKNFKNSNSDNASLLATVNSIEWIKASNSLFLSGIKTNIGEVTAILKGIDVETVKQEAVTSNTDFILYKPKNLSPKELKRSIDKVGSDLESSKLADPLLIQSLQGIRLSDQNTALIITGNEPTLKKIKEIVDTLDIPAHPQIQSNFLTYKTQYLPAAAVKNQLLKLTKNINEDPDINDSQLVKAIENSQIIESSNSLLFTGTDETLAKIKHLLATVDSLGSKDQASLENSSFFVYRPTKISAQQVIKSVESIAADFEKTGLADRLLIRSLQTARIVENGNAVLFTSSQETLTKVKSLLESVDSDTLRANSNSQFLMYKAIHIPAHQIRETLLSVANDLEHSGLSDQGLIQSIRSSKLVSQSNSVVFTGSEASLVKIKELLGPIDVVPAEKPGIQHVGSTTFMIYQIKEASPTHLMESLRSIGKDIVKTKGGDAELTRSIDNMRFVEDTHSIVFTGTEQTLTKIQNILDKFDVPSNAKQTTPRLSTEDYVLYEPKNLNGDELIHLVQDFESHLKSSGVHDASLFDTIKNLKWMPKTTQILVSGDKANIAKVTALLERFDTPQKVTERKPDTSIETFDETSFLIYKVQYHQGNDIVGSIRGIADDLSRNPSATTQALVKAIRSIQFIQVTNSLIATGDPKVLVKLKDLIHSVDIPLKQVFIEVLVLETDLTSSYAFGLRWAAQGTYKDRLGFGTGTGSVVDTSNNYSFPQAVQKINATNTPTGADIPIANAGGSLGVIGDLIFHKGQTYVSLGDFVNAVQSDVDATVVLNQKMITQDNRDTTLFVGQNVPYNGSVVTNSSQVTTVSANIEYRDIGIQLKITPTVGDDDIVTMEINQDITEQIGPAPGSSGGSNNNQVYGITTRKTTFNTNVHVPDKHFVVLTGQIRNSTTRTKSALPCLGGLPLIGAAFQDNGTNKVTSNIVMFIKPHIVNSYEDYKKLTERQEDLYRNEGIAEDIDNGIELVRTPDDL
jgi:type II secretory pathway component GspD/PulD (secretin)